MEKIELISCGYDWLCPNCECENYESDKYEDVCCLNCNFTYEVKQYIDAYSLSCNEEV